MRRNFIFQILLLLFFALDAQAFETNTDTLYYVIGKNDNLFKLATSFDVSVAEIQHANPQISDINLIYAGAKLIMPTNHLLPDAKPEGIVINLAEPRLYFFKDDSFMTFPIAVGKDNKTPTGHTKILSKKENPSWIPPASIREEDPNLPEIVEAGPQNPLGKFALYLDASHNAKWQNIMIHGTNQPKSIGANVSHGCMRLYPQDIEKLFAAVEIGTAVTIVDQKIKIFERENKIFIEAHFSDNEDLEEQKIAARKILCQKISSCESKINWNEFEETISLNLGIPVVVSLNEENEK